MKEVTKEELMSKLSEAVILAGEKYFPNDGNLMVRKDAVADAFLEVTLGLAQFLFPELTEREIMRLLLVWVEENRPRVAEKGQERVRKEREEEDDTPKL